MPFMWVCVRLTIMKLASRKNMMSINGMISIRACFFGIGDRIFILVRCPSHGESDRDPNSRDRPRLEPGASESRGGRVIQNGTSGTRSHARIGYAPIRANRNNDRSAPGDL